MTAASTGRLPAGELRTMFDRIAPVYDLMNRAITAGLDGRWRRLTAQAVVRPGDAVLDACCGTGDLALADAAEGGCVTGLDFSAAMLERARRKSSEIGWVGWVQGDLLARPFGDGSFDAVTVGFGVRHAEDLDAALRELRRVLRQGGRLAVLDIVRPKGLLAAFYGVWFDRLIPLAGKLVPGGIAYTALPASVRSCAGPEELEARLREAGFGPVAHRLLAGSIVVLIVGEAA